MDSAVIGDINRLCRIPLSIHEKSGEECIIVNNQLEQDKVRSIEYHRLYGLKQMDIKLAINNVRNLENFIEKEATSYPIRHQA